MPFKENTFEGGTDGTVITTGNSGGASGAPWDLVRIDAVDATAEFDNARAMHGAMSARLASTATAASVELRWTFDDIPEVFTRFYMYLPSTSTLPMGIQWLETSAFAVIGHFNIIDSGGPKLQVLSEGDVSTADGTIAVTRDAWIRIETRLKLGAAGLIEAKLFNSPDISTADETVTVSYATTNSVVDRVRFGWNAALANRECWFDSIAMETSGYLGPYAVASTTPSRRAIVA